MLKKINKNNINRLLIIFLLPVLISFFSFYDPSYDYEFINFTMKDGLESLVIYSIFQDNDGFLWFGGEGGLTRYDGYYFKSFRNDPLNLESISSNNISSIFASTDNKIWIGTWGGGLNLYDSLKSKFIIFKNDKKNKDSISGNRVQAVFEDKNRRLWAGTYKNGLNLLVNGNKFKHYLINEPSKRIWTITQDKSGEIWVGTNYGLYYYNEKEDKFKQILLKNITIRTLYGDNEGILWIGTEKGVYAYDTLKKELNFLNNLPNVPINAIVKYRDTIWIGTYGKGLIRYNVKTKQYIIIKANQRSKNWLTKDDIRSLFIDKSLNLWIGTRGGGLLKLNIKPSNFYSFNLLIFKKLKDNKILSFEQIDKNKVLIGTNNGINYFDLENKNIIEVKNIYQKEILNGKILSILKENKNILWISVKEKGLFKLNIGKSNLDYNIDTQSKFNVINIYSKEKNSIGSNVVNKIYKNQNRIFACTDNGLFVYNSNKDIFENILFNGIKVLNTHVVNDIVEIIQDEYLIATESGLLKIRFKNKNSNEIEYYFNYSNNNKNSIRITNFLNLTHSKKNKNIIWIGSENGLIKYDIKSDSLTILKDRLFYNVYIAGIVEEKNGNLWISTKYGILNYNIQTNKIKSFYNLKGVLKEYLNNSFLLTDKNEIFFGGLNGFTNFNPDNLIVYHINPPLQILSIKINENEILNNRNIKSFNKIIVPPGRNKIYVEATCLDLTFPEKNVYFYKLEGYDKDWVNNGNKHFILFTNLKGGNYVLKIKALNYNEALSKNVIAINFFVKTPFYFQWWAFIIYILFLLGIIYIVVKIKTRFNEIEIEKQKIVIKELTELDRIKDEFFQKITYELELPVRNSITLLKSLLNINENIDGRSIIPLLSLNIKLSRIINEILLYTKLKSNDLRFEFNNLDLYELIERVIYIISFYIKEKNIKINNKIIPELPKIYGDWIKLEEVFFNLFELLIRFIDHDEINIDYKLLTNKILIILKCKSCSINKDVIKIINKFINGNEPIQYFKHSDIGLNLSIAKKIIENHNGELIIKTKQNKIISISLALPILGENDDKKESFDNKFKNGKKEDDSLAINKNKSNFENEFFNLENDLIKNKEIIKENQNLIENTLKSVENKNRPTILFCDNDISTVSTFVNYCSSKNFNFIVYKKIEDVIYTLIKNDTKIDLLIINSSTEDKKSFDFIEYVRSKYSYYELPILVLVEKIEFLNFEFLLDLGVNDIIFKPINFEDFKFKINTFLKLKEEIDKNEILKENINFKNNLIRIIGHDLRNPLSVILIGINALKNNIKDDLNQKYIEFLEKATIIIQDVLNNFLEYAKLTSGKVEINFAEDDIIFLIKRSINDFMIFAKDKGQNIIFNSPFKSFVIKLDKFLFKRVVDNLLSNAIKYSKIDSKIYMNANIIKKNNKKYFYLEVVDSGKGIPENEVKLLFNPFQKLSTIPTKGESSTGLGLAIAKSIVELHSGNIGYKKNKNGGSIFFVELPVEN